MIGVFYWVVFEFKDVEMDVDEVVKKVGEDDVLEFKKKCIWELVVCMFCCGGVLVFVFVIRSFLVKML